MSASAAQASTNETASVLASSNAVLTGSSTASKSHLKMTSTSKVIDGSRKQSGGPVEAAQKKPITPKAWTQGTNPITQRSANQIITNGITANPKQPAAVPRISGSAVREHGLVDKHAHDRLVFLLANFKGLMATLTLKNGEQFNGVFSGASLDPADMRYILKMTKKVHPPAEQQSNGVTNSTIEYIGQGDDHVVNFAIQDVVDLQVAQVVIDRSQNKSFKGTSTFRTDSDISGGTGVRERNLKRWEPTTNAALDFSLEDSGNSKWDQFEANERLYGVKSNYDEKYYTTTIDKSNPLYSQRAAAAEKLAREIEASGAMTSHVAEERGQAGTNDTGPDEEDKYSGVRRDFAPLTTKQTNAYTPPAKRAPTGQYTVPGAPVDPAIISSQLAPSEQGSGKTDQPSNAVTTQEAQDQTSRDETKAEHIKDPAPVKDDNVKSQSNQKAVNGNEKAAPPTTWKMPASGTTLTSSTTKAGKPDNVEHDLLDSFKQFSAQEKLRMAERQRSKVHADKAVKLNDLKKFSQNFKLQTPVPTDLVPILAKEKMKQEEIVEKALRNVHELKTVPSKSLAAPNDPKLTRSIQSRPDNAQGLQNAPGDRNGPRGRYAPQNNLPQPGRVDRHNHGPNFQPRNGPGLLSERLAISQQQHKARNNMGGLPPVPIPNVRIPPAGPLPGPPNTIPTPSSAASTKFNVWATEFRPNPAVPGFTPSAGASESSSPRMEAAVRTEPRKVVLTSFTGAKPRASPTSEQVPLDEAFNPIKRMKKEVEAEKKTKEFAFNGGIPQAYRTPPTWDVTEANREKTYADMFERAAHTSHSASPSYGSSMGGPMPHQHQLPLHLQNGAPSVAQPGTPHHTPRQPSVQPHHGPGMPHHFEEAHRMQPSASTSSMYPSPRGTQPYLAYNTQVPHPVHIYPHAMPAYGMSPGGHAVALRNVPAGTQFIASQGPGMGGHVMTNQHSGGPYMGIPINPQMHMFSPTPAHIYPHHAGPQPGPPSNGYPSPRPAPMMSNQGSQQAHPPQPVIYLHPGAQGPAMLAQAPLGPMTPMRGSFPQQHQPAHYGSSPHQTNHYSPHQHRGTPSGGYAQPMMASHTMPSQIPPHVGMGTHAQDTSEEVK